jgi:hypothetical protein
MYRLVSYRRRAASESSFRFPFPGSLLCISEIHLVIKSSVPPLSISREVRDFSVKIRGSYEKTHTPFLNLKTCLARVLHSLFISLIVLLEEPSVFCSTA